MEKLIEDHSQSPIDAKTAGKLPEEISKRTFSKGDARYWLIAGRLFKDHDVADYSCRFSHKGKRVQVCLNTSNIREAARRAADLYLAVTTSGWQTGLKNYRPEAALAGKSITVGKLIETASSITTARRHSLDAYKKAFRLIVSEIKGISFAGKFSSRGGSVEWQKRVDAVHLETLKPADIIAWRNKRLRENESDPLARRRAIITTNSTIRNAKALFATKHLPFIEQTCPLPRPLPFEGVTLEKSPSMRYSSKIDPYAILAAARDELSESDPEAFKIILLALVCGLRKSEIDNLLWRAFDFTNSRLKIESSEYHELKSEDSAGEIDLDADTLAIFRGFRAQSPRELFVINSTRKPRNEVNARCYRCESSFKRVLQWLKDQGVDSRKPIHTMRKEIGSIIASEHGIFEASRYLRHSDVRITAAFYTDKKKIITPATFAGLLSSQPSTIETVDFHVPATASKKATKKARKTS
jgi:integrase